MKNISVWALITYLSLFSTACSAKRSLVGKWEEIGGTERIEFIGDGSLSVLSQGMSASGNYTVVDATHIKFGLTGLFALAGEQINTFSIKNDQLSLTDARGKTTQYKRAK